MSQTAGRMRIRAALISVQVLFGINYLASKFIVTHMAPGAWALLRTSGALLILGGIVLLARRPWPSRRDTLLLGVAAMFGIVLNQGLFLEGLSRTTVSHSALICSQIPTFVLLFSVLSRQEKLSVRKGLSFVAGIGGVLILLEADRFRFDSRYLAGDLMTLANAASFGLFVVLSRRIMARNDPWTATAVVFLFGTAGMALYGGPDLLRTDFGFLTPGMVGAMVYVIIGATVVTYFLNLWAVKRTQATRVALYIFLQPLIATVLGILFRSNEITGRFLVATALVFVALMLRDNPARQAKAA